MPLKTDLARMCYPLLYQVFRSAHYGIITALPWCSYGEMYIRHKYNITVTYKVYYICHCTTQHRSMIHIQSARMCFIKLHQYRIFFISIIVFRKIKYSFIRFILVVSPFHQFCSSPLIFTLLRIDICYANRIGKIRFTPPQITEFRYVLTIPYTIFPIVRKTMNSV